MVQHKFKVGQLVRFTPRTAMHLGRVVDLDAPKENFEVTRLLPPSGSDLQYRIKGSLKGQERVVTESEIG